MNHYRTLKVLLALAVVLLVASGGDDTAEPGGGEATTIDAPATTETPAATIEGKIMVSRDEGIEFCLAGDSAR